LKKIALVSALLVLLGLFAAAGPARPAPAVSEVIIVFKTHFDIGYTDLARAIVQRYRTTMIDQALDVVDRNRALPPDRRFVWTLPGWPMAQIAGDWPGQTPGRK
jgi:alpha-mannosidase